MSSLPIAALRSTPARSYTAGVYAVVLAAFAVFAAAALVYQLGRGTLLTAGLLLCCLLALSAAAFGIWTQQTWRYRLAAFVHGALVVLGILALISWIGSVGALAAAAPALQSAPSAGVWLAEVRKLPVDTLPLADSLLLLLNAPVFLLLRFLQAQDAEQASGSPRLSTGESLLRRFINNRSARVGGVLLVALLLITYLMPRVNPYYGIIVLRDNDLNKRLNPPECLIGWIRYQQGVDTWDRDTAAPTSPFDFPCDSPFGYDKNGRDITRRVLHGISVSLAVSVTSVSVSLLIGAGIGLLAGYTGGALDSVFMRLMDVMLAFPSLLLAIAIVAMRGPGLDNTMLAIGIVGIPVYARLARAMAISTREQEFVTAARSIGAGDAHIILRYVLPNSLAPLIVQSTLGLGTAVIEAAALGFLGLGQQPPFPELGKMLAESREVMTSGMWWVMLFPGVTVMLIVLSFNLLGDALRDTLDPKLRGR